MVRSTFSYHRNPHPLRPPPSPPSRPQVNSHPYTRLSTIGRGGSSKVYKVLSSAGVILALKKVHIEGADKVAVEGYLNEIALLRKLKGSGRVVEMVESEVDERAG